MDQGHTGAQAAQAAAVHQRHLKVVKLPEARTGLVLLLECRVIERRNAWVVRCRRLARDDAQWAETLR